MASKQRRKKSSSASPAIVSSIFILILVTGLVFAGYFGITRESALGEPTVSASDIPILTSAGDRIILPRYANMICKESRTQIKDAFALVDAEDFITGALNFVFESNDEFMYKDIECKSPSTCDVRVLATCGSGYSARYIKDIKDSKSISTSDSRWNTFDSAFSLVSGEKVRTAVACRGTGTINSFINPSVTLFGEIQVNYFARGIYIEGSDAAKQGLIPGTTPDCSIAKMHEGVKSALKNAQSTSDTNSDLFTVERLSELATSEQTSLVVGYRDDPAAGNIVDYNGKKISCITGGGVYETERWSTVGGVNYYKLAKPIISGSAQCCSTNECGSGRVCDQFQCKTVETAVCKLGSCDPNFFVSEVTQTVRDGQAYSRTTSCGTDKCIQESLQKIECTAQQCADRSTLEQRFICDINEGCVDVTSVVKQNVVSGQCAADGGKYNPTGTQSNNYGCNIVGKQCCFNYQGDPLLGLCQDSCTPGRPTEPITDPVAACLKKGFLYEYVDSQSTCGIVCTITFGLVGDAEETGICRVNSSLIFGFVIAGIFVLFMIGLTIFLLRPRKKDEEQSIEIKETLM